ncbi:hypothetical protein ALC57_15818 [Trachymyrmex cornetzi]|uniref:Uncharacterized protein n=1 Tax=Trachymyrmex cornetzi TaxID=471704 RepID=A0A151IW32_9HYME|nr:hypothetical protein ALC57_15818 [Trachymyrmex cornetzi]
MEVLGKIEKERDKKRKGMGWWDRECREKEGVRRVLREWRKDNGGGGQEYRKEKREYKELCEAKKKVEGRVVKGERGRERQGMERELSREEMRKVTRNLKDGKAMGLDGIPNKVWKYIEDSNEGRLLDACLDRNNEDYEKRITTELLGKSNVFTYQNRHEREKISPRDYQSTIYPTKRMKPNFVVDLMDTPGDLISIESPRSKLYTIKKVTYSKTYCY